MAPRWVVVWRICPPSTNILAALPRTLQPVLRGYIRENKRTATIAVGCTGDKHRSVAIIEDLAAHLRGMPGVTVAVKHRDLGRE